MKNKLAYILDFLLCLFIIQPLQFVFTKIYIEEIFNFKKDKDKYKKI